MNTNNEEKLTCNIVDDSQYKKLVNMTLNEITKSLSKSLGYYGSSAVIEDKLNGHIASKDGYTILSNYKFQNPIATAIYDIIRKISFNLVQTVGDGSTSSVVIATELFNRINESIENRSSILSTCPPKTIFDNLKEIEKYLVKEINRLATPITDENFEVLRNIAEVSNNNDDEVGKRIYDIYKEIGTDGFIYLENSKSTEEYYEFLNGIEFASGMISEDFSDNRNKPECIYKDAKIFMCNDRLDSGDLNIMVDVVGNLISRHTVPVIIIAKGFSQEFVSCWSINKRTQQGIKICLVDFNFANKNQEESFKDIALYTGSKIYNKQVGEEIIVEDILQMFGSCKEATITNKTTRIIGRNCSDAELNDRIDSITEQIDALKAEHDPELESRIFQLETRKANLNSTVVKYYVGGSTDFEKNNRKYLIEDSIFACKAALISGYVAGGNLTIPKIINRDSKSIFEDWRYEKDPIKKELALLIKESFSECFFHVLNNKFADEDECYEIIENCINNNSIYNLKKEDYEKDNTTTIINSAMTEIEIMKAVFSIIGILVTSNQFIGKAF